MKRLAAILALAAVYFCAGKFGLSLASLNGSASAVWPPTGIALAAVLLWGHRLWPGIFLGAFLVNFATTGSPVADLGIAVGNTVEAVLGAWLVNRYAQGTRAFDRAREVFKFVVLAAMLSTVVSATLGVTSLCLGREARWEQYPAIWLTWWLGDMVGALVVAPLLVIWLSQSLSGAERKGAWVEGAGLLSAVVLMGLILFLKSIPFAESDQFKYLSMLPILWAAFRFGQRGAITSVVALSGFALWGTLHGVGPFVTADANQSLLWLQAFVGTISLMALVVAALVSERERFEHRLQVKDAVNRVLAESSTLEEATPKIIQTLCETSGWDLGAFWDVDRSANELRCVGLWRAPYMEVPEFEAITRQSTFPPGIGLPGRVWSSGKPAWIADVTRDGNFPRAPFALKEKVHAGFCFPIKLGDEVLGVLECFSRQVRKQDEDFLRMLDNIGSQLGQFIVRKQAEETHLELLRRERAARASAEQAKAEAEKQLAARQQVEEALGRWADAPLPEETRSALQRYSLAAAGVACALLLRLLFAPNLGKQLPLVTAYGAVALAVWYGGRGPALFACLASYLGANWLFIEPRYTLGFALQDVSGLSLYLLSSFLVIVMGERMRRAHRHAHASAGLAVARQRAVEAEMEERKRAEQAVRQNEERLRTILDSALDAVITIDAQGCVAYWNPQAEKIFGWSKSEAVGKRLSATIIPPQFREAHERGLRRYFETGAGPVLNQRIEITALHRDGREFPVELAITPVVVDHQVYFSASIRDITERKRAEERLRVVVEAAPNAMIMVGEDGCIALVNVQAEKLFGYERPELLGQATGMLVPERFRTRHPGMRQDFFAAPQARAIGAGPDLYGLCKDGSEVPIEIGLNPITTAEGRFVLASIIDITERKKAEERLRRFNAELEAHVEERTAELRLSEERVRTSLQEKELLLQEIHHRVKNNLQIIASLLSLQSGYIRDPQMVAQFRESEGRIRSMALIHEKLYGSESLARVDLADYVQSLVCMLLRTYATNANVKLDVRLDPAAVSIDTAVPMGLLLNELVTNALKHAFPDGRRGCLLVALEAKPERQFAVRVEDDGVGLGPDFQFEQANTLGLRLVRMFAKQLRAEVTFRSEAGHTAFDIRLQEPICLPSDSPAARSR